MPLTWPKLEDKIHPDMVKQERAGFDGSSSDEKNKVWKKLEPECDKFYETKAYSDKETYGYVYCCDFYGDCGTSVRPQVVY